MGTAYAKSHHETSIYSFTKEAPLQMLMQEGSDRCIRTVNFKDASTFSILKIPFGIRRTDYKEIAYKIQQFKRTDSSAVGMHIFNLLEFKSQDLPVLSNQNSDMVT